MFEALTSIPNASVSMDSDFYRNDVAKANRSRMNVPFQLADSALDKLFLEVNAGNVCYAF